MLLTTVQAAHDMYQSLPLTGVMHADAINITPEAPPKSDGFLRLVRWLLWGVTLSGVAALIYAGGKFGWEKYNGGTLESPKIVVGALIGGVIAMSAGTIINAVIV